MKTALLVVDVQNFYLHDAPDELPGEIAEHIDNSTYDYIAFTVFKNNPKSNFVKSLKWRKCDTKSDIQLPPEIRPYATKNNVFIKSTYSGFHGTKLHTFLQNNKIEKVVICGVDTDACVLATAFSAFDHGYLIDVNTELTHSGKDLEFEAQAIINRSLIARE